MQPKITYSYPIYHLLSRPQKLKIQACQNIPIYKFILSNVLHDQHPNSEYMAPFAIAGLNATQMIYGNQQPLVACIKTFGHLAIMTPCIILAL